MLHWKCSTRVPYTRYLVLCGTIYNHEKESQLGPWPKDPNLVGRCFHTQKKYIATGDATRIVAYNGPSIDLPLFTNPKN